MRKLVPAKRETPENLWVKCPDTGEMIYRPDLEAAMWVTPSGHHMRIRPELPVIVCTGYNELISEDKAMAPPGGPVAVRPARASICCRLRSSACNCWMTCSAA